MHGDIQIERSESSRGREWDDGLITIHEVLAWHGFGE